MKIFRIAVASLVVLWAVAALAQSDSRASFEKVKSLEGTWVGKSAKGPIEVSFRTTSGGSAVMSEIRAADEDMISMFHLDGDRLLMTHYCAAGNQPRMQATASPDGKTFTFDFIDGTNLTLAAGHMQRMVLTILDESHHSEDWTFLQPDGKEHREHFDLQRKS